MVGYHGHVASTIDAGSCPRWLRTRTETPLTTFTTSHPTPARPGLARPCVLGFRFLSRKVRGPLVLNPGGRADLIFAEYMPDWPTYRYNSTAGKRDTNQQQLQLIELREENSDDDLTT